MEGKDFYFELTKNPDDDGTYFTITPVEYYDREGCLSDQSGVADGVVPEGFYELAESMYEFEGTPELGRELLLQIGMKEIKFGFQSGEESIKPNDLDDYYEEQGEGFDDNLDSLLNDRGQCTNAFDYKNITTDKLLRHLNMMLKTDSFEEAAKIRDELKSRGVTDF